MSSSPKKIPPALWLGLLPLLMVGLWLQARQQSKARIETSAEAAAEARRLDEQLLALNAKTIELQEAGTALREEIRRGFAIPGLTSSEESLENKSEAPPTEDEVVASWKRRVESERQLLLSEVRFRREQAPPLGLATLGAPLEDYLRLLEAWDPVQAVFGKPEEIREQNRIRNLLKNQESHIHQSLPELREKRFAEILREMGQSEDRGLRFLLDSIRQEDVDFPRGFLHVRIIDPPELLESTEAAP